MERKGWKEEGNAQIELELETQQTYLILPLIFQLGKWPDFKFQVLFLSKPSDNIIPKSLRPTSGK